MHVAGIATLALASEGPNIWAEMLTTIVAFGLFYWVLKRFAWGPLTQMLDSRREAIEEQFDKIETLQTQAKALEDDYRAKMRDIDNEARRHVQDAVAEGRRVRDEIIDRAREEADELREKQERLLEFEVAKARIEMRDEIVAMTVAATEKLLHESVDTDRHRRLVSDFIEEVQTIDRTPGGGNGGEEG